MKEGDRWLAGAQILFKALPHLSFAPFRIAYIPKGPLLDWSDRHLAETFLQGVHQVCRRKHTLLLRIEPELPEQDPGAGILSDLGFEASRMTVQPRTTLWLDISDSEEAILAGMKQKWRYNIRLSARKGVQVRQGKEDDLPLFTALMQQTAVRNQFGVHPPAYYQQFWRLFAPSDRAALLIAEHEGVPLAAIMVGQLAGKAYYFYGASGNQGRNLMPNHALQWAAIQWAKAHGCIRYDFWGIPDELGLDPTVQPPEEATGLWGVWRFKQGFGGDIVRYVGAWDHFYIAGLAPMARRLGFA